MPLHSSPRLVIAGTHSGVGKTTAAIGLMAAFRRRGLCVQSFKVGPDYIDPSFHAAATGRTGRNLDPWMVSADIMRDVYLRASADADIALIEGVMGLYDGKDPLSIHGSTAEVAILLSAPVLLVIDASAMARSAAALVRGFQSLHPEVSIAGVFVNRVGGEGHYQLVKAAVEGACGIPTIGYLTRTDEFTLPERHLGLVPALEFGREQAHLDRLAEALESTCDLDAVHQLAMGAPAVDVPAVDATLTGKGLPGVPGAGELVTIAIAKDAAFHFYYPENFELLEAAGARLVYFSPLADDPVPAVADGLYIGGGFPEQFAELLAHNRVAMASVRDAVARGLPTFAECGGFMYLTQSITTQSGDTYPMVGVIPAHVHMQKRLAALGYRDVNGIHDGVLLGAGDHIRGHEFHYSTVAWEDGASNNAAYRSEARPGHAMEEGYVRDNLQAGYTHLYFLSNPRVVTRFVTACAQFRARNGGVIDEA